MKRSLFNVLAAVSLALCGAALILWASGPGIFLSNYGGWGWSSSSRAIRLRLGRENGDGWMWTLEYWKLALLALLVPAYRVYVALQSRRRVSAGLCIACGYDLRASKDRCPECGAAIPAAAEDPRLRNDTSLRA